MLRPRHRAFARARTPVREAVRCGRAGPLPSRFRALCVKHLDSVTVAIDLSWLSFITEGGERPSHTADLPSAGLLLVRAGLARLSVMQVDPGSFGSPVASIFRR